jgi:poly(A) polymerase
MRVPVADIDLATTLVPEAVVERARAHALKPVPTGLAHGTITVVVDGTPFEVTTLRADVATDGRHAEVAFGRDWSVDAHRRDFTVNALYVSPDGTVHDFVGGIDDCAQRRIRFIGDAAARIGEDYLRILRFFRFHAAYGADAPDPDGLAACIAAADGIARLSAERLGQEMKKLLVARRAGPTVALMAETGILARVLGDGATVSRFARLRDLLGAAATKADAALLLAALHPDGAAIGTALRLSRAEIGRMTAAQAAADPAAAAAAPDDLRRLVHRLGRTAVADGLRLAVADGRLGVDDLATADAVVTAFDPGPPPVRGRDLAGCGLAGPEIGRRVREAERLWVDSDFTLDRAALLAALDLPPRP